MKNLNEYLPKEHPTKSVFIAHGIPIAAVANYLGLATNYTGSLLSGIARMTSENDRKLTEFARFIESEAKGRR